MSNSASPQTFGLEFADPMASSDVLNDFDFDTFLHESNEDGGGFDFGSATFGIEGTGEIGAD